MFTKVILASLIGLTITSVPYEEAHSKRGVVYEDNSEEQCLSGVCGI